MGLLNIKSDWVLDVYIISSFGKKTKQKKTFLWKTFLDMRFVIEKKI